MAISVGEEAGIDLLPETVYALPADHLPPLRQQIGDTPERVITAHELAEAFVSRTRRGRGNDAPIHEILFGPAVKGADGNPGSGYEPP